MLLKKNCPIVGILLNAALVNTFGIKCLTLKLICNESCEKNFLNSNK